MHGIHYLVLITVAYNVCGVCGSSNTTNDGIRESLSNLTSGNDLWSSLLKKCMPPTFACIRNITYDYLKHTLDYPDDVEFTNFLKFPRNSIDYSELSPVEDDSEGKDSNAVFDDTTPLEEVFKSLTEKTIKFFVTHDMELELPEKFFHGGTVKISPRSFEDSGALIKFEIIPKSVKDTVGEGRLFFKRIRKFISQRLIYALLAILLVIKLLAVKLLFVLPTIVGVATAKKLLLKVLLFVFPALHHLFKLCAYVPYGAKHHIHKHQVSHIHEVAHHPHHHGPHKRNEYVETGPHYEASESGHVKIPYHGKEKVHRKDLETANNEIGIWNQGQFVGPTKYADGGRPLTSAQIENLLLISEREAELKRRLQKHRQKIHEENIRLQEQLSNALKIQQKLKQQAMLYSPKIPANLVFLKPPNNNNNNNITSQPSQFLETPQQPFSGFVYPQARPEISAGIAHPQQNVDVISKEPLQIQKKTPVPVKIQGTDNKDVAHKTPSLENDIYQAAVITYDAFYSPILEKINKVLEVFALREEPCKERLICSMYKNPPKFSPHSNLLSAELSRDPKDLQKPTSTNSAIIRFYRYVQAARDGQDKRDCLRLYPACQVNTEL